MRIRNIANDSGGLGWAGTHWEPGQTRDVPDGQGAAMVEQHPTKFIEVPSNRMLSTRPVAELVALAGRLGLVAPRRATKRELMSLIATGELPDDEAEILDETDEE